MKVFALVLALGNSGELPQMWSLSEGLTAEQCRVMLTLPQDILLTTWGSLYAEDGFDAVMAAPDEEWSVECVEQQTT